MTKISMHFNLWLYTSIAICAFSQTTFGGDEAAKYLKPEMIFWLKYGFGAGAAGLLAIKMFCSTTYGDYMTKAKADAEEDTQLTTKTP